MEEKVERFKLNSSVSFTVCAAKLGVNTLLFNVGGRGVLP